MRARPVLLAAFLLVVSSVSWTQVSRSDCESLKDKPGDPSDLLPMLPLTDSRFQTIEFRRACIKSYSAGFPGGEEAFTQASAAEIKQDLLHVQKLFDNKQRSTTTTLSHDDELRVLHIELGWSREQVLLFGNWAYLQRLRKEGDFATILEEVSSLRRSFDLSVVPLQSWDKAQNKTYFSPQTLKNMIVAFEYSAKGNTTAESGPDREALVKAYLVDAKAFTPTMKFTGNPGKWVLGPVCDKLASGANN